jgi:hypothetical protein
MSKTVSLPFDLSSIALAFSTAEAHTSAFDCMTAEMLSWHLARVFPSNADLKAVLTESGKKASTAAVYASAILKWAKSGKTPASLHACIAKSPPGHVKAPAGRPAGKGAGKTTKPVVESDDDSEGDPINPKGAADAPSPMHRWVRSFNDFGACAFVLRDASNKTMTAADASEAQDLAKKLAALLGKYTA